MKKWLWILALCLVASPAFGFEINAGISGSWFNDNKPGHGFAVEFTENEQACEQIDGQGCLVVYWFAYDKEGDPMFLLGVLPVDGNVAEGEMLHFSGQEFGSFTPPPTQMSWGTLTLRFTDCSSGFARYESGFMPPDGGAAFDQEGNFKITRLAFVSNINCAKAQRIRNTPVEPASGVYLGLALSRDFEDDNDFIRSRGIGAVIKDSGEAFRFFPGPATYRGQLTGDGLALEGELDAMAAFGQELPNGEQTGTVQIRTGSAATLEVVSAEGRPGDGRAGDFLEGTFDGLGQKGDFQLKYQNSSNRPPDVTRGARCWAWTANGQSAAPSRMDENGNFAFELSGGCKVTGQIQPAGEPWNVFTATAELTDGESACDFKGSFEGVAAIVERSGGEPGNDKSMLFTLDNGTNVLTGFINSAADSVCDGQG